MKFTQMAALIAGLTLAISSSHLRAQTTVDGDFQDAVIETTTKTIQQGQMRQVPAGGVVIVNTNSNDNKNDSAAAADSESETLVQPTTVVESSIAVNSSAENLRNARKDAEISTEQKIVEKLEASRLEDERRRADALFGDRFESMNKKVEVEQKVSTDIDQSTNSNIDQSNSKDPVVVIVEDKKAEVVVEEKTVIKEAPVAPVVIQEAPVASTISTQAYVPEESSVDKTYFGLSVGSSNYSASNVETQYAVGAVIGKSLDANWSVEGRFGYSNYYINTFWIAPLFSELNQYDFGLTTRYNIFTGRIKPFVGAGVAYVHRTYTERVYDNGFYDPDYYNTEEATTSAVDGTLLGGVDFEVSPRFTLGAEMSYTSNVFVKNDEPVFAAQWAQPENRKALEEIARTSFMVNAKYTF